MREPDDEAVRSLLRKAGVVQPPWHHAFFRRLSLMVIGALVFSVAFLWIAIALTTWQAVVALFEAGFDLESAVVLLYVATQDNMTVAGLGLLGLVVGALAGLLIDL